MNEMQPWDWHQVWMNLERLGLAYLIALPVGWEREREAHSAGIRTFPIVSIASCGYVLTAQGAGLDPAGVSRVLQGLITGIGFVGAGAILKEGLTVHGTATAASIWSTSVIGASVAVGRYDIAIALSVLNLLTLRYLIPIKAKMGGRNDD